MKIIRWIILLPCALAAGVIAKILWEVSNMFLIRFELGLFTQWLFWGIGEVIGVLAVIYTAIKIAPSRKKIVAYVLCLIGFVLGFLTATYVGYLLFTLGINSDDPEFLRDLIQGTLRCIIEAVTSAFIFIRLKQGHLKNWIGFSKSREGNMFLKTGGAG
jgi:hypothetical protein